MKIAIGADHAGFEYKELIKKNLASQKLIFEDKGTHSAESADYPDFAHPVAIEVENGSCDLGILICGSANGVAMTANKHQKIRAALCWKKEIAVLARQHNDANIVCIPARFTTAAETLDIVKTFLETSFEGGRHERRVTKISC